MMAADSSPAISITFSVVILMTVLFIKNPWNSTHFQRFIIATVLRLALNLASTRLILADGHTGTASAGRVIEAFGNFVVGGNYVIGIIVFGILSHRQFRRHRKVRDGSLRSPHACLDAMPGKQMAIDADLSSGLIGEDEARKRRSSLEEETRSLARWTVLRNLCAAMPSPDC